MASIYGLVNKAKQAQAGPVGDAAPTVTVAGQTVTKPTLPTAPVPGVGSLPQTATGSRQNGMPQVPGAPVAGNPGTFTGPGISTIGAGQVVPPTPTAGPGTTPIPQGVGNPGGTVPSGNPYLTPFGPGNDLIGQQINPTANPRLQGTMGAVDAATQALAGAPDRQQLASDYFQSLLAQAQPQFDQNIRSITQRNAAAGRLGSGMYGSNLVDAATQYQQNIANAAGDLAYNTGSQAFSDRLSGLGALSGLESQQFGQGQAQQDALRQERQYQYGLDQNAVDRQVQQQQLQDYLLNSQFNRDQSRINTLAGLGYGGNPSGTYLGASGQAAGQAAGGNDLLYQLLAQYGMGG